MLISWPGFEHMYLFVREVRGAGSCVSAQQAHVASVQIDDKRSYIRIYYKCLLGAFFQAPSESEADHAPRRQNRPPSRQRWRQNGWPARGWAGRTLRLPALWLSRTPCGW